jgi:hypothetical protein
MRRLRAGIYESADKQHRLIRTEWDGPRGGRLTRWEHARPDRDGTWVIDGFEFCGTLKQARAELEQRLGRRL